MAETMIEAGAKFPNIGGWLMVYCAPGMRRSDMITFMQGLADQFRIDVVWCRHNDDIVLVTKDDAGCDFDPLTALLGWLPEAPKATLLAMSSAPLDERVVEEVAKARWQAKIADDPSYLPWEELPKEIADEDRRLARAAIVTFLRVMGET